MKKINGILFLYHHPLLRKDATTIMEHVRAFEKNSKFQVFPINTELGFPDRLSDCSFSIIVIHYSMFNSYSFYYIRRYLENNRESYIIAFFQDEYHFCKDRFELINKFAIDCIYTLVEPSYFPETYQKYTGVKKIICCLPGYVSDELIKASHKYSIPDAMRPIDIGYRGRPLPYYMGKGSQEKTDIADKFLENIDPTSWKLDIKTGENDRIYGDDWLIFLGKSKGMLGVEAGVSVFDVDDAIYKKYQQIMGILDYDTLISKKTDYTFDEISEKLLLEKYENNIYYRMVSPRIFEAAAFRICQILYEGKYSGILIPWIHYLPLKKDFSNFEEIMRCFSDPSIRKGIVDTAYRDLIQSGEYSYEKFIRDFDRNLNEEGFTVDVDKKTADEISELIHRWAQRATKKRLAQLRIAVMFTNLPKPCKSGIRRISMFFSSWVKNCERKMQQIFPPKK